MATGQFAADFVAFGWRFDGQMQKSALGSARLSPKLELLVQITQYRQLNLFCRYTALAGSCCFLRQLRCG